nr:uncharacterized protein LOC129444064 [Misgurnus anguillicaudatus]
MAYIFAPVLVQFPGTFQHQCEPWQCVKGDPKDVLPVPYHSELKNTVHAGLKVNEPQSSVSGPIHVNVFDGSKGTSVALKLNSRDTIGKLKQEYLKIKPGSGETLNLSYNGKPVGEKQTLSELQVKHGATFIIFFRCPGG